MFPPVNNWEMAIAPVSMLPSLSEGTAGVKENLPSEITKLHKKLGARSITNWRKFVLSTIGPLKNNLFARKNFDVCIIASLSNNTGFSRVMPNDAPAPAVWSVNK